ncbi:hypothetical protein [Paenarthrobacter sp. RAF54_2]|uniref:hypothetical protein n=1 Tax=Paenarthrobacter sp. RAF54_2 TaxID=3233061 RepID=UPI003F9D97FB
MEAVEVVIGGEGFVEVVDVVRTIEILGLVDPDDRTLCSGLADVLEVHVISLRALQGPWFDAY